MTIELYDIDSRGGYMYPDPDGEWVKAEDAAAAINELRDALERALREAEVFCHERNAARARVDSLGRLLTGIHSLLYPAPITTEDGRTMVFRPKDPDPHEVLQELSDRIRALPDEIAKL